ncbi:auxin efflux carrier [Fimicolochytrium jonesii]|uniref:auxin efflux carrier n=1 Tax=Fimicolochytrium jonesii TaxID=1396493 RepID=UPI0022FE43B8|nr:auxin efflux carrier [Fimicolochytrium jonesii]KAI8816663.1 auxin efflux carrier [Fimicolochytrium jonesii]
MPASIFVNVLVPTLQANAEIFITTLSGALLGRIGVLTSDLQKGLAKVSFWLLTPALIFSKIASTVDSQRFISLWPIPALFVFSSLISYALSLIGCRFLRVSLQNQRFITAAIVFTNTVTIPVPIITALTPFTPLLVLAGQTPADAISSGVSMALFFTLFSHVFRWSIGYRLLDAPAEKAMQKLKDDPEMNSTLEGQELKPRGVDRNEIELYKKGFDVVPEADIQATSQLARASLTGRYPENLPFLTNHSDESPASVPGGNSLGRPLPIHPPVARRISDAWTGSRRGSADDIESVALINREEMKKADEQSSAPPESTEPAAAPGPGSIFKKIVLKFCDFMNPPFLSALVALFIGFHPSLQTFFFKKAGSSIGASLTSVGETSIPFQLIQLGGRLQRGPTRDSTTTMPNRAIAFVVFCRLVLGPLIGLAFVGLLTIAKIAPKDPMLIFVLLMESSTPPALNLAVIAELHGMGEKDIANLLFWNYAIAIPGAVLTVLLYLVLIPSFVR